MCAPVRAALAAFVLSHADPASAQVFESVGTRAQGMAGAFVGVADDATASWWNPAGLASGSYFNLVLERGRTTQPAEPGPDGPASRLTTSGFAVAFPALGANFYRLQVAGIGPINPIAGGSEGRQPEGGARSAHLLAVSQFGITVGQSMGDHLVVGSTLKILRGGAIAADIDATGDGLDRAAALDPEGATRGDLDLGAMARAGRFKAGLTLRNVTKPAFGDGSARISLVRQARAGLSLATAPVAAFETFVLAADADLSRTPTRFGDVRHAAAGVEAWLNGRRLGVRAGTSTNTVGEARPSWSTGVSVAPIRGLFIEASKTTGQDDTLAGWTTTLRFAF